MKSTLLTASDADVEHEHMNDTPVLRLLDGYCIVAVIWLLLVGLWSGPTMGASLAFPNGLLAIECGLAIAVIVLARYHRIPSVMSYPFFRPCLAVLLISTLAMATRACLFGGTEDWLTLWRYGEPMVRGLLLYLVVAGRPRLVPLTVTSLLAGMLLLSGATILQHVTGTTRWYVDLDGGWSSGIQAIPGTRAQGLTSYINLTAAMLAASIPYWVLPLVFRIPHERWKRLGLLLGGAATTAAFSYTNSRGPLVAIVIIVCLALIRLDLRWGFSIASALGAFLLVFWLRIPWLALLVFLSALPLGLLAWKKRARYWLPSPDYSRRA